MYLLLSLGKILKVIKDTMPGTDSTIKNEVSVKYPNIIKRAKKIPQKGKKLGKF